MVKKMIKNTEDVRDCMAEICNARWITVGESLLLSTIYCYLANKGREEDYYFMVPGREGIFGEMQAWCGYSFLDDPLYDYYKLAGNCPLIQSKIYTWLMNRTMIGVEFLRRLFHGYKFYDTDSLVIILASQYVKDYFGENNASEDEEDVFGPYIEHDDEDEEGPFGGAFRDQDDYWSWKEGSAFYSKF